MYRSKTGCTDSLSVFFARERGCPLRGSRVYRMEVTAVVVIGDGTNYRLGYFFPIMRQHIYVIIHVWLVGVASDSWYIQHRPGCPAIGE